MGTLTCAIVCCVTAMAQVPSTRLDDYMRSATTNRKTCGPLSLWYCLRRLGHDVAYDDVLKQANLGENGVSLAQLLALADSYHLPAEAVVMDKSRLRELPVPSILVIGDQHCVVYDGYDPRTKQVVIFEPTTGVVGYESVEYLSSRSTGEAIVFEPPRMDWGSIVALAVAVATIVAVTTSWLGGSLLSRRGSRS